MDFLYDFKQANRDRYEDAGIGYNTNQTTRTRKNPVKRLRVLLMTSLQILGK